LGIVHRDLKPANLFCVRRADGLLSIKVLDFGISKFTAGPEGQSAATHANTLLGSPAYMSPEQLRRSREVDTRTDIWSLGIILFELLTARPPFVAHTLTELAVKIAIDPPFLVRSFRPDVPDGVERAVMRCLEKDRERRLQNVGELALALLAHAPERARPSGDRILRTLQAAQSPAGVFGSMTSVAPAGKPRVVEASWGRTASRTPRRDRSALAALAAAVVVFGGLGLALLLERHPGATGDAVNASPLRLPAPGLAPSTEPPTVGIDIDPAALDGAPLASATLPPPHAPPERSSSPSSSAPSRLHRVAPRPPPSLAPRSEAYDHM
jgi:serine/threonine-protein kinase